MKDLLDRSARLPHEAEWIFGLHISVWEAVSARLHGGDTGSAQCAREKGDVALLILGDARKILIVGGIVAGSGEVFRGERVQGSDVESILEMFKLRAFISVFDDEYS